MSAGLRETMIAKRAFQLSVGERVVAALNTGKYIENLKCG